MTMNEGWLITWRDGESVKSSLVRPDATVRLGCGAVVAADGLGVFLDGKRLEGGRAARAGKLVFSCLHATSRGDGRRVVSLGRMVGASEAIVAVMHAAASAGLTREPVLILGESGSGKELVAEYLGAVAGSMNALNMGAVPPDLAEAELFGWVRVSFTGAVDNRAGALESAKSGVLFLDEIAEAPAWVQVKLLRALDSRVFRRLGSGKDIALDARVVAATNVEPVQGIADGVLRLDLLERLACHVIRLPPLRSRPADLPCLIEKFCAACLPGLRDSAPPASPSVMDLLRGWSWPGNVRELKNVVARVLNVSADGMSDPALVRTALEEGRMFAGTFVPETETTAGPARSRRDEIDASRLPRSTYYYRLKRGRIPSDSGPRRAPTCAASKT
jgi:DNA-binding NtrC family response regulator